MFCVLFLKVLQFSVLMLMVTATTVSSSSVSVESQSTSCTYFFDVENFRGEKIFSFLRYFIADSVA